MSPDTFSMQRGRAKLGSDYAKLALANCVFDVISKLSIATASSCCLCSSYSLLSTPVSAFSDFCLLQLIHLAVYAAHMHLYRRQCQLFLI